jgi:hypothetical protein
MWIRQVTRLEIRGGFTDSARRGPIGSGGPRAAVGGGRDRRRAFSPPLLRCASLVSSATWALSVVLLCGIPRRSEFSRLFLSLFLPLVI